MVPPSPALPGAWCREVDEMDSWLLSLYVGKRAGANSQQLPASDY